MQEISALPITGIQISDLNLLSPSSDQFLEVGGTEEGKISLGDLAAYCQTGCATAAQGAKADTAVQPGSLGSAAAANLGTAPGQIPTLNSAGKIDYAILDLGWTTITSNPTPLNGFVINDAWPNLIRANLALRLIEVRFSVTRPSTPALGTPIFSWSGYVSTNTIAGFVSSSNPFAFINNSSLLFAPQSVSGPVSLLGCVLARY
jgi:hypothetical protein